jgi:F-type H+-transporting ATPase subunit b
MILASSNFLVPNATFFVELIAFVILLGVVGKWILPPINRIMEKRQQDIAESLRVIEAAKAKMEEASAAYEAAMARAHSESRSAIEQANRLAEEIRAEARAKAQAEYDRLVSRAASDIESARQQAVGDLREQAAELAIELAAKVIGAELDAQRHRHLVDEVAAAVESQA